MKKAFLAALIFMTGATGLGSRNIFNSYNIVSPLGLASGGLVAPVPNDSFNFYSCPSLLGIVDYSYFEFSYAADSFENGFLNLSMAGEKKDLSPYTIACKFYYNDFSDEVLSGRSYGINPALSVRLRDRLWAGMSLILGKNSFAGMNHLFFVSSFSVSARLREKSIAGLFARGLGRDLTDFGRYSDSLYPDAGFVFHQAFSFPLEAHLVLDYSEYAGAASSVSFLYNLAAGRIRIIPLAGLNFRENTNLFSSFSFGLGLGLASLRAEFGFTMIESETLLSVSIKHISF